MQKNGIKGMVRFIPAAELKNAYDVFGHFYTVEVASGLVIHCRSVLELVEKTHLPRETSLVSQLKPDAVFIMMNPGSSEPLVEVNNHIQAASIHKLPISLVPTKPDTTQYQVMRLMHYCGWHHVRVLNLSDLRCSKSIEFFKQYQKLETENSYDAHSLFSSRRERELASKLTNHTKLSVVRAWGLSSELNPLIERCLSKTPDRRQVRGLMKEGTTDKYLHPLPTLQRQKIDWVNRMVEQLD
jgi:hypothetical protein